MSLTISQLIVQYRSSIYGFILAHMADVSAAEDLMQEVCLVLWEKWDTYDQTLDFGKWARGIARYKILQHYRRAKKKPELVSMSEELSRKIVAHPVWQEDEVPEKVIMRMCVKNLGDRAREILEMKYEEGLSGDAISKKLGILRNSVFVALTRIKMTLLKCVESGLELSSRLED